MYRIIDMHAHIYPQKIAQKASDSISDFYHLPVRYDGTVERLLSLGDTYGVEKFLVHSVATSAAQVARINDFVLSECRAHHERFVGFATMHPDFADPYEELTRIKTAGLRGVKLHPDFQKFFLNDRCMDKIYDAAQSLDLPVLFHTGDPRYDWSSPKYVPDVCTRFPKLKIICAHFGGYSRWEEAAQCLKNEKVWVDTSSSLFFIGNENAKKYIGVYGVDHVLFGSDYPMWNVGDEIRNVLSLGLSERDTQKIFFDNIKTLLNL